VTGAGISFFLGSSFSIGYGGLILATVLFSTGFILHELAHKYVAQAYGLWAEFRLNLTGALLTAVSMVSPLKFIAPGAVMISGFADRDKMGRTAIAGPIVNILITAGLLVLLPVLGLGWIFQAVLAGASINSFLALFNLIPFAIFDGRKVYVWNRRFWAMLFLISLGMTIYTNFILRPF
jgi:Zn-dependent protease